MQDGTFIEAIGWKFHTRGCVGDLIELIAYTRFPQHRYALLILHCGRQLSRHMR